MKSKAQLLGGEQAQVLFWFRIAGGGPPGVLVGICASLRFSEFFWIIITSGWSGMFTNHSKRIAADKLPDR
jgi:hypothetical protein